MKKIIICSFMVASILLLAACGAKKAVVKEQEKTVDATTSATQKQDSRTESSEADKAQQAELQKMNFLHKVIANASNSQFVASKISLNIQTGSKDMTVPGLIRMKKDDVIRLHVQIPLLGSEVGRLEFTKDYVLILDRIHKEYFKADYNKVDFLHRYGLTFESLQALFWNELTVPGYTKLTDDALKQLNVEFTPGKATAISVKKGNMTTLWHADNQTGQLKDVTVSYGTKPTDMTRLTITYDEFRTLGVSQFPAKLAIGMNTNVIKGKAKNMNLNISMDKPANNGDWDTRTEISKKYKEVSIDDVLKMLTSL